MPASVGDELEQQSTNISSRRLQSVTPSLSVSVALKEALSFSITADGNGLSGKLTVKSAKKPLIFGCEGNWFGSGQAGYTWEGDTWGSIHGGYEAGCLDGIVTLKLDAANLAFNTNTGSAFRRRSCCNYLATPYGNHRRRRGTTTLKWNPRLSAALSVTAEKGKASTTAVSLSAYGGFTLSLDPVGCDDGSWTNLQFRAGYGYSFTDGFLTLSGQVSHLIAQDWFPCR
jgi:hypothetical protein